MDGTKITQNASLDYRTLSILKPAIDINDVLYSSAAVFVYDSITVKLDSEKYEFFVLNANSVSNYVIEKQHLLLKILTLLHCQ